MWGWIFDPAPSHTAYRNLVLIAPFGGCVLKVAQGLVVEPAGRKPTRFLIQRKEILPGRTIVQSGDCLTRSVPCTQGSTRPKAGFLFVGEKVGGGCVIRIVSVHAGFKPTFEKFPRRYPRFELCILIRIASTNLNLLGDSCLMRSPRASYGGRGKLLQSKVAMWDQQIFLSHCD